MKKKDGIPIPKPADIKLPDPVTILPSMDTDSININGSIPSGVFVSYNIILIFEETYTYLLTTEGSAFNFRITCGDSDLVIHEGSGEADGTFTVPMEKDSVQITITSAADDASYLKYNLTITKTD
jgi:hypothetical protein